MKLAVFCYTFAVFCSTLCVRSDPSWFPLGGRCYECSTFLSITESTIKFYRQQKTSEAAVHVLSPVVLNMSCLFLSPCGPVCSSSGLWGGGAVRRTVPGGPVSGAALRIWFLAAEEDAAVRGAGEGRGLRWLRWCLEIQTRHPRTSGELLLRGRETLHVLVISFHVSEHLHLEQVSLHGEQGHLGLSQDG